QLRHGVLDISSHIANRLRLRVLLPCIQPARQEIFEQSRKLISFSRDSVLQGSTARNRAGRNQREIDWSAMHERRSGHMNRTPLSSKKKKPLSANAAKGF